METQKRLRIIERLKALFAAHRALVKIAPVSLGSMVLLFNHLVGRGTLLLLDAAQAAIAVGAFFMMARKSSLGGGASDFARAQVNQFVGFWYLLWGSWFALYAVFGASDLERISKESSRECAILFNILQAFACFRLASIIRPTSAKPIREYHTGGLILGTLAIVVFIASPEFMAKSADGTTVPVVQIIYGSMSGVLAAFALICLARRLEIPFFGLSSFSLNCLFLYAIIQPLFPIFRLDSFFTDQGKAPNNIKVLIEDGQVILKFLAAFFKIVLLVSVEKIRLSGALQDYLEQVNPDAPLELGGDFRHANAKVG